jgi:peptidyl-prolyl cis-trans isomerase C
MSLPSPKHPLRPALLALALVLPVGAGAADAPAKPQAAAPAKDPVIATINGKALHASDLAEEQRELGPQGQHADYGKLLDRLVAQAVIEQAARAEKLDADPEVKKSLARVESRVLIQEYLHRVVDKAETDAAIKAKFAELNKSGAPAEEVKARHILLKTEDEAKEVIAELDKGGDFAKIANEKSQDKGSDGGELGWFTKDKMVPEFATAAFAMKPGDYSKTPVKSQFGWHVIQVEDRRAVKAPTLDEKKEEIQESIANDVVTARLAELKSKAKIEEFNADGTPLSKDKPAPALEPTP